MGFFSTLRKSIGLEVQITGDNSDAKRAFKDTERAAEGMSSNISGSMKKMALLGGGAFGLYKLGQVAIGFQKASIQTASFFETTRLSLDVLTKSAENGGKAMAIMRENAAQVPYELTEVMQTGRDLLARGFGVDKLNKRLQLTEDLATGTGKGLKMAVHALGMLKAGAFGMAMRSLRMLGISRPDLEKEGMKFGKSGEMDVKNISHAIEIVDRVIESKFGGITMRLKNTWTGTMSMIADAWTNLKKTFTEEGIFSTAKGSMNELLDLMKDPATVSAFRALGALVGDVAKGVGKGAKSLSKKAHEIAVEQHKEDIKKGRKPVGTEGVTVPIGTTSEVKTNLLEGSPSSLLGGFLRGKLLDKMQSETSAMLMNRRNNLAQLALSLPGENSAIKEMMKDPTPETGWTDSDMRSNIRQLTLAIEFLGNEVRFSNDKSGIPIITQAEMPGTGGPEVQTLGSKYGNQSI